MRDRRKPNASLPSHINGARSEKIMLNFILGSIYTLIILSLGFILGVLYARQKVEEITDKVTEVVRQKLIPTQKAGPVKAITRKEKEDLEKKPITDRIRELVG